MIWLNLLLFLLPIQDSKINLSEEEKVFIYQHPVIRLGGEPKWEPFIIEKANGIEGVDRDFLDEIERTTGLRFEIVTGNWSDIVIKAKNREIDGLLYSSNLPEREAFFAFTEPYVRFQVGFYGAMISKEFNDMKTLIDKKVAIQKDDLFSRKFVEGISIGELVVIESREMVIQSLLEGKVDYYFGALDLNYYLADRGIQGVTLKHIVPNDGFEAVYSIRKDYPELKSILNKAIESFSKNISNAILQKWSIIPKSKVIVDKTKIVQWALVTIIVISLLLIWIYSLRWQVIKRKEIEKKLKAYKVSLQAQIENSSGLIYTLDKDLRVIIRNRNFEEFVKIVSGKSISIGDNLLDFMGEDYKLQWNERYRRALNGEKYSVEDLTEVTGELKSFITSFNPIEQDGEIQGISCFTEDVTEHTSLNRYMVNLMESSIDYIFIKDLELKYVIASQSMAELNNLDSWRDMIGKTDFDIDPSNAHKFHEDEKRVLQDGIYLINKEYSFTDKEGNVRWVQSTNEPLFSEKGNLIGLSGISRDITAFKRADDFNTMLLSAVEATGDIIVFFDKELRFLYLNQKAIEIYNNPDYLGRSVKEVLDPDLYQYVVYNIENKLNQHHVWKDEYEILKPGTNQRIMIDSALVKVVDEKGKIICYANVSRDITDKNQLKTEIQNSKIEEEKLIASQKAEENERNRLAAELHDGIQQKLAAATISLQSLSDPTIEHIISLLKESVKEVRETSHNLSLRKLRADGLTLAIQENVESLNQLEKVKFNYHDNILNQRFDFNIETNIYRIYQEATSNILKYANAKHVTIQILKIENFLTLHIEDDGIGFDEPIDDIEGFGIKNIKERVLAMRGALEIDSSVHRGTNLIIEIEVN